MVRSPQFGPNAYGRSSAWHDLPMRAIGHVRSPYVERFGVPRQSGLAKLPCTIALDHQVVGPEATQGLETCTHIWVIFEFHRSPSPTRDTVRPPRLGGNERMGVFATRSPVRPNPLGLSVVRLLRVDGLDLEVEGGDIVDGTPVLDIKPYVPYADAIGDARCAWAESAPTSLSVRFASNAREQLSARGDPNLQTIIEESLRWDPRPAYRARTDDTRIYGTRLGPANVRWRVEEDSLVVTDVEFPPSDP